MRFVSFVRPDGLASWGSLSDTGEVADLGSRGAALAESLRAAIEAGVLPTALDVAALSSSAVFALAELRLLPVVPDPGKILCVGANYRDHRDEAGRAPVAWPTIFTRFADTQIGHGEEVRLPAVSTALDYEGELAFVVSRPAWQVPAAAAIGHIAGFACYNDFSVRDWQRHTSQWTAGKNFPGTGAFGPYLVPAAEIADVGALTLQTRVNGAVRQQAVVADLIFGLGEIIAYLSTFTPLRPGDVVVTGTPGGVGLFLDPPQFLQPGDVVEVEVGPLGVLRNVVSAPA